MTLLVPAKLLKYTCKYEPGCEKNLLRGLKVGINIYLNVIFVKRYGMISALLIYAHF